MLVAKSMYEWTIRFVDRLPQKRLKQVDWTRRLIYLSKTKVFQFCRDIEFQRKVPKSSIVEVKRRLGSARLLQQLKTMVTRLHQEYVDSRHTKSAQYLICSKCCTGTMLYERFKQLKCLCCRRIVDASDWVRYVH